MKYILTFSKHLSNIGWISNLVALQHVDGESPTRNVPMQVTEILAKM